MFANVVPVAVLENMFLLYYLYFHWFIYLFFKGFNKDLWALGVA